MNKKSKNIEQLYSESFNNFRVEPSSGLWKKISSKLAWRNFFTFTPTTLNAWYVAGLLTITTAGVLLLTKPATETNKNINEITINKPIENTVITTAQDNETVPKEITTKTNTSKSSSSGKVLSNAENQKSESGINDQKPETRNPELVTRIVSRSEAKVDNPQHPTPNSQLATPHPKPTQHPAPSTDLPDPWPNMDTLFTNNTPTPPEYKIQFPNAFTPNPNGPTNGYYTPGLPNNDVFHPECKGVVEYHLSIFNRRGELIFECNDINVGWDGYINNRLASQGVYIWKARGRYSNGQNFIKAGNVMLIIK